MIFLSGMASVVPTDSRVIEDLWGHLRSHENDYLRRRSEKIDRFSALSLLATCELSKRARLVYQDDRIGIMIGNMLGGWSYAEPELHKLHESGIDRMGTYQATAWFPAAAQGEISIAFGLKGVAKTFSGGPYCVLEAMTSAFDALTLHRADAVLVGAAESLYAGLAAIGVADLMRGSYDEGASFALFSRDPIDEASIPVEVSIQVSPGLFSTLPPELRHSTGCGQLEGLSTMLRLERLYRSLLVNDSDQMEFCCNSEGLDLVLKLRKVSYIPAKRQDL